MLAELGEDARVLAGGQSLVPMLNLRLARPSALVDVGRVEGLAGISANGALRIGATTRQADALRSAVVGERAPLLTAALRHVGHPATRSRGTIGGSIAHADPAAELPAVLLALDGEVIVVSAGGERVIPAASLFTGPFETALEEAELVTAVRFGDLPEGAGFGFSEIARRRGRFRARRRRRRRRAGLRARRALRRRSVCLPGFEGGAGSRAGGRGRGGGGTRRCGFRSVRRSACARHLPARGRSRCHPARSARGGSRAWLTSASCSCA